MFCFVCGELTLTQDRFFRFSLFSCGLDRSFGEGSRPFDDEGYQIVLSVVQRTFRCDSNSIYRYCRDYSGLRSASLRRRSLPFPAFAASRKRITNGFSFFRLSDPLSSPVVRRRSPPAFPLPGHVPFRKVFPLLNIADDDDCLQQFSARRAAMSNEINVS